MIYLNCNKCKWRQDKFWDMNEIYSIDQLKKYLFTEKVYIAKKYFDDAGITFNSIKQDNDEKWYISGKEFVSYYLKTLAEKIDKMFIVTLKEWEDNKDNIRCPKCGKNLNLIKEGE